MVFAKKQWRLKVILQSESGEQTKNCDDDNVMIGENIDESKTNLDAMQRPNINSDLAVKKKLSESVTLWRIKTMLLNPM